MNRTIFNILFMISIFYMLFTSANAAEINEIEMTIPTAIEIALSNNLNLKIQRLSPVIEKENIESATSVFDPTISASGIHSRLETTEDPVDMESVENIIEVGIGKTFSYGTNLSINLAVSDDSNTTNSAGGSEGTAARTTLVVTQPLLKNRGSAINERNVVMAKNSYKKSELSFKQSVIDLVAETKNRYWQLFSAIKQREVQEKSLLLAKQFLTEVEAKIEIGSAAALESLRAKAEVASREEALIAAENNVMNAQDNLLNFIYGGLKKEAKVRCAQEPMFEEYQIDPANLLQKALAVRADYLSAQFDVLNAEIDVAYTKNQKKPQLDIIGSLGYNEADVEDGPSLSTAYQDYYSGEISLSLALPWGFRSDKSNYRAAKLSLKQAHIQLSNIESKINLELRTAMRNVKSAHKRYQAASLASKLADETLVVEQEKYKSGMSTSYNVLLYQRDLIDALFNLVDAGIGYQLAIVDLNRTVGITMEQNNIEIKGLLDQKNLNP